VEQTFLYKESTIKVQLPVPVLKYSRFKFDKEFRKETRILKRPFECQDIVQSESECQRVPRLPASPSLITFQFHPGVYMWSIFHIRHLKG